MMVYQAQISRGGIKIKSAEVLADCGKRWEVNPTNEISHYWHHLDKSEVHETPELAVAALATKLRRGIEQAMAEVKSNVRNLERCFAWKDTSPSLTPELKEPS